MGKTAILALMGSISFAKSVDEFESWMRTIDEKNQSVQRNIAAKDSTAAAADAKTLGETFQLVENFWKQRSNAQESPPKSRGSSAAT